MTDPTLLSKDQKLYELKERADKAEQALQFHGFVRCDIAACNCGSWHPRYGLPERFRDIEDAFAEADIDLNGRTLLTAIKSLITVATLASELCNSVDAEDMDVGGHRPSAEIFAELGPACDAAKV